MFDFKMRCLNKYICLAKTRPIHGFPHISFRVIWIRHTIQVNVNLCLLILSIYVQLQGSLRLMFRVVILLEPVSVRVYGTHKRQEGILTNIIDV